MDTKGRRKVGRFYCTYDFLSDSSYGLLPKDYLLLILLIRLTYTSSRRKTRFTD